MVKDTLTKIPIIITLDSKKNMQKVVDKMTSLGITVNLSLPEPIPIITCLVSSSEIQILADLSEIKKIEYDGKTYAL